MAIAKKIASGAAVALVALGLVVFAVVAVGPRAGGYRTLTVLSASMRPALPPGALAIVRPTPVGGLEVGDVITYRTPVGDRRVVTHRIIEIVEHGERPVVRTKGDANDTPDPWLARLEGGVAWELYAGVPGVGFATSALRQPLASSVLVLGCPLLLCILALAGLRDGGKRGTELAATVSVPSAGPRESAGDRRPLPPSRPQGSPRLVGAVRLWRLGERGIGWTNDVATGRRWRQVRARRA